MTNTSPTDSGAATGEFTPYRPLLFRVAYHLLGTVADAEDTVQETWLAWDARCREDGLPAVDDPRAYLVRVATNQALARRRRIERRKETYVGSWLPEPVVEPDAQGDGEQAVTRGETVSLAMLVVLESLGPVERAVFVLREVFGFPHAEIAAILGRGEQAVRQMAHRSREHVRARRPRFRTDPAALRLATGRFLTAALGGDLRELLRVLAPDVTLYSDGGGKSHAAGPRPVHGREKVSRLLAAYGRSENAPRVEHRTVNGDAAAVLYTGEEPLAVMSLELDQSGRVESIYVISNPDKLAGIEPSEEDR